MDAPARSFPVSMGDSIAVKDQQTDGPGPPRDFPDTLRKIRAILFDTASEPIIVSDEQGRIFGINAETEKRFGYSGNELLGQRVEILIPERLRELHARHRLAFQTNANCQQMDFGCQMFGRRKDGTEFSVDISMAPMVTDDGILFCSIMRDTSEQVLARQIAEHLRVEKALAGLSAKFINLPASQVDAEITSGLRALIDALDTDRVTLAQVDPATTDFVITHAFARPGIPYFSQRFPSGVLPWLAERVMNGEIVAVEKPEDLPKEAHHERNYMESVGEKSTLVVPLRLSGRIAGGISTDTFREGRHWDDWVIYRFQDVADILSNALSRKRADEELQNALAHVRELKDKLEQENICLREEIKLEYPHSSVVGDSEAIRTVLKKAQQVASTDSAVLILGETGTGKELIARTIHEMSRRKNRPMIKVNCAALPSTLIESELFGREKGAYTGALAREIGRFELADKSTIFLDEIGELPPETQPKLLRVLQEGEFERLGGPKTMRVDVRVIAATSRNLQAMVHEGKFREDLFYRLNVFPIVIPPLRERREDIPALVWHLLLNLGQRMGRNIAGVHAATMCDFQNYPWPGNVRELANIIERNLIVNTGPIFHAELPEIQTNNDRALHPLEQVESEYLLKVLQATRWRVRGSGGAAEVVGLKATTLEARLKKLGIRRPYLGKSKPGDHQEV